MQSSSRKLQEPLTTSLRRAVVGLVKLLRPLLLRAVHPRHNTAATSNNIYSRFCFSNADKVMFIGESGQRTTYGDYEQLVGRVSRWLMVSGLSSRDRLMVQLPKSCLALALIHACMKTGATVVPLSAAYRHQEMRYFIEDAQPKILVTTASYLTGYTAECTQGLTVVSDEQLDADLATMDSLDTVAAVRQDDVAAICYTSGTTGEPKGNLTTNAAELQKLWEIDRQDTLLHALPLDHVHGLFISLNTCLSAGSTVVLIPTFKVKSAVRWLPECTVVMAVPTHYTRLLQKGYCNRQHLGHLRLLVSGSAPLLMSTWLKYAEVGQEILERYGMTEGQIICSNPFRGRRKPGTVGPPLPGVRVTIRDGLLHYKGPNTFKGYWRKPEKTKEDFTEDDFFNSGDMASMDEDGYVQIIGRRKDLVITGGLNVYPKELELLIDALEAVHESAVIGVPHADYGEAVVAIVALESSLSSSPMDQKIIDHLKQTVAGYKVPKKVIFMQALPRNPMGKVQKNILREQFRHLFV